MFGEEFFKNSVFLFTRWSYDPKIEKRREAGREKTMSDIIKEFCVILNETFSVKVTKE